MRKRQRTPEGKLAAMLERAHRGRATRRPGPAALPDFVRNVDAKPDDPSWDLDGIEARQTTDSDGEELLLLIVPGKFGSKQVRLANIPEDAREAFIQAQLDDAKARAARGKDAYDTLTAEEQVRREAKGRTR